MLEEKWIIEHNESEAISVSWENHYFLYLNVLQNLFIKEF